MFERSEVAKQRLRIIEFYKRYGERATKEAFGVDRRLVSRWRRRLADAGGDVSDDDTGGGDDDDGGCGCAL